MAGTTTNLALPYPSSTDADNVPSDIQALAVAIDTAHSSQGLYASRPAAGHKGAMYYSTDKDWWSRDDGATWHDFQSKADADGAYLALTATGSNLVTTAESTASTTFTDLTTVGPAATVTVGPSGRALVIVTADMRNATVDGYSVVSYAISGATTGAAVDATALYFRSSTANGELGASRTYLHTGLTPGSNTFTLKYRAFGGTATFQYRQIVVIPL